MTLGPPAILKKEESNEMSTSPVPIFTVRELSLGKNACHVNFYVDKMKYCHYK